MKRIGSHIPYLIFLIIPLLVYYWRIIFAGEIICGGDMINQFVPWREFALHEIWQGRFPIWNPWVFCGTPFAANIQTSLFYPWNLLNLFLSVESTFSLSLAFHHALSLLGMYLFLYKLWGDKGGAVLGALAYGWSGFFITHGHDGHLIHARAYALLPFALYIQTCWRDRLRLKSLALFAIVLSGLFYAGHTQIPLYVYYLLMFRAVWWGLGDMRSSGRIKDLIPYPLWTLAGQALALGLAAFVIVPLLELSSETASRAGGADYQFATSDSMPPQHIITLAIPFFYGDPTSEAREGRFWETKTGYHEISGYCGVLPLILLLLAFIPISEKKRDNLEQFRRWDAWFFLFVTIFGILFAMGEYNPLYPLLYYGLPGWSYFRVPGRLLLMFIIGVSVLSARGMMCWRRNDFSVTINSWQLKTGVIASVLLLVLTIILSGSKPALLNLLREFEIDRTIAEYQLWFTNRAAIGQRLPNILFETRYAWMLNSCLQACAWAAAGWISLFAVLRMRKRHIWIVPASILVFDLLFFSARFVKTLPADQWRETFFPETELVQVLKNHANGGRILCLDDAIGYPAINTHPELRPNRLMHYGIMTVRGYDPLILRSYAGYVNRIYGKDPDAPQGGLLLFPSVPAQEDLCTMNVSLVLTTQSLSKPFDEIWCNANSGLKVYCVNSIGQPIYFAEREKESKIDVLVMEPSYINFSINTPIANSIIIPQNYYKGWRLEETQQDVSIEKYKDTFLAVKASSGKHHISLSITPFAMQPLTGFTIGVIITVISILIILSIFFISKKT